MRSRFLRLLRLKFPLGGRTDPEPLWAPVLGILVILALQLTLADRFTLGPTWLAPLLELALLAPRSVSAWRHTLRETSARHYGNVVLIALINAFNLVSLALLVRSLLRGGTQAGPELLLDAVTLWVTNVIGFALWYWEVDRGGPWRRRLKVPRRPDFLFPQMTLQDPHDVDWRPDFGDYLFVAFTNAAAFSPTDTLPLTGRVKMLMMTQAFISLLTVAIVASRAVNILR
ncbi:hypothetical protein [Deinococcus pimensis]|uniref:hypothetical protein n=1 Tax=Deinococcus pimensis TaxID=309888 RepID=UPI0004B458C2|nr:hypothetical protein [Deinococcus pimensis]